jgi:omega-amidase
MLSVGLIQFAPVEDLQANYATVTKLVEESVSRGATLIVLPEIWTCEFNIPTVPRHSEQIPGPSTDFLSLLAKRLSIWVIGGTIPHLHDSDLLNTCVVLSPTGELIGQYSKQFLFKIDIPGQISLTEATVFSRGRSRFSFSIGAFKIGIGICFDVRFPQLALDYLIRDQCNVLVYPSAFSAITGPLHWKLLGRARAIDTLSWVVMVSASYREDAAFRAYGYSFVATPNGEEITTLGGTEGFAVVTLTEEAVNVARRSLPVIEYQREIYGEVDS